MIEILKAGALATVQDLGRRGHRHLGVVLGGATDPLSFAVGNRLVGNAVDAAGIEFTFGRATLRFDSPGWIALTGAECSATLDGELVPTWWRTAVAAGQTLQLDGPREGIRTYLTVSGGIDVPIVLGSRSTDIGAGFGGFEGRALRAGDKLSVLTDASDLRDAPRRIGIQSPLWSRLASEVTRQAERDENAAVAVGGAGAQHPNDAPASPYRADDRTLSVRVMRGPDYADFSPATKQSFWGSGWTITPDSNRMGYRLDGTRLACDKGGERLSHAVLPGTVQVPPDGQPILLMCDAQTTGGYPRIGAVIGADLWRVAQAAPGTRLRFVECSVAEAISALEEIRQYFRHISLALNAPEAHRSIHDK
ncbi:MAG: biotin-dependent carboxyltransferase family protein [Janthinobacterium lividum]